MKVYAVLLQESLNTSGVRKLQYGTKNSGLQSEADICKQGGFL